MNPITTPPKPAEPLSRPRRLWARLRALPLPTQRWLAGGLVIVTGLTLVPWPRVSAPDYQLGMIQPTAVIADFDFPILKDQDEMAREQDERARSVPAVVMRADTATSAAFTRLARIREQVRALRLRPGALRAGAGSIDRVDLPFSQETLIALLVESQGTAILDQATSLLQDVMQRGFVSPELAAQLADYREVRVRDPLGDAVVPVDQLLTADRLRDLARSRAVARSRCCR